MTPLRIIGLFLARDFDVARSYRFAFAFEGLTAVANVAMFFYLSKLIDSNRFGSAEGLDQGYFAFAVIGLALLGLADTGVRSFATQLRQEQMAGTVEALATTPVSFPLVVLSGGVYALARGLVIAALTLLVATIGFGFRPDLTPTALATCLVVIPAFLAVGAAVGITIAAITLLIKQTSAIAGVAAIGITLLSGAYYPVDVLPAGIQTIAEALPLTWGIDAMRDALLGGNVSEPQVAGLVVTAFVSLAVSLYAVEICVRRAKRRGVLTAY